MWRKVECLSDRVYLCSGLYNVCVLLGLYTSEDQMATQVMIMEALFVHLIKRLRHVGPAVQLVGGFILHQEGLGRLQCLNPQTFYFSSSRSS